MKNTILFWMRVVILLLLYIKPIIAQTLASPNYIYYYNAHAVYTENIKTEGSDTIYNLRKMPDIASSPGPDGKCLPMTAYTFLGPQLIKRGGIFILFNQQYDSIYLDLNQSNSWYLIHRSDSLQIKVFAKVTGQTFDSIFNEQDSVTHLSLLVLNFNGDTLKNHRISFYELKISAKYGWLSSLNWNKFPYLNGSDVPINLIGILAMDGSMRKGVYNKYNQHTIVHDVGDEIHEAYYSAGIGGGKFKSYSHLIKTKRKVTSKLVYADSTIYTEDRNRDISYQWSGILQADDSSFTALVTDTLKYTVNFSTTLYPYTFEAFYGLNPGKYGETIFYYDSTMRLWAYMDIDAFNRNKRIFYHGSDTCWKIVPEILDPGRIYYYYDGIGGAYGEDHNGSTYSTYNKLLYFKTSKGKWGIPIGINENQYSPVFKIFPNPAKDKLSIETGRSSSVLFTLYDLRMIEVLKLQVKNLESVTLPELQAGIYVYRIWDQQRNSYTSGKLMIVQD